MRRRQLVEPAKERRVLPEALERRHDELVELVVVQRAGLGPVRAWHVGDEAEGLVPAPRSALARAAHLARRMKSARVIDPADQPDPARVFFGATVTLADEEDQQRIVTLVGDDEQDAGNGAIGWSSPMARALRGAAVGDVRTVRLPGGEKDWEVIAIRYA